MATNKEIDAAFEIAARKSRWSINRVPLVREMLEAAEKVRADEVEQAAIANGQQSGDCGNG